MLASSIALKIAQNPLLVRSNRPLLKTTGKDPCSMTAPRYSFGGGLSIAASTGGAIAGEKISKTG